MRSEIAPPSAKAAADADRYRFIERLDAAPFGVLAKEAELIELVLTRPQGSLTPVIRGQIDLLRDEYEARLL